MICSQITRQFQQKKQRRSELRQKAVMMLPMLPIIIIGTRLPPYGSNRCCSVVAIHGQSLITRPMHLQNQNQNLDSLDTHFNLPQQRRGLLPMLLLIAAVAAEEASAKVSAELWRTGTFLLQVFVASQSGWRHLVGQTCGRTATTVQSADQE